MKVPDSRSRVSSDDVFREEKRKLNFEKVLKTLPNIVDLRDTVDVVVHGKLNESELKGIKFYLYEMPGERIIYRGSLLGIMHMPKNRIKIPISSEDHLVYGVFYDNFGMRHESVLEKLQSGELIIRSHHFDKPFLKE